MQSDLRHSRFQGRSLSSSAKDLTCTNIYSDGVRNCLGSEAHVEDQSSRVKACHLMYTWLSIMREIVSSRRRMTWPERRSYIFPVSNGCRTGSAEPRTDSECFTETRRRSKTVALSVFQGSSGKSPCQGRTYLCTGFSPIGHTMHIYPSDMTCMAVDHSIKVSLLQRIRYGAVDAYVLHEQPYYDSARYAGKSEEIWRTRDFAAGRGREFQRELPPRVLIGSDDSPS